jgi:hypothetical protein
METRDYRAVTWNDEAVANACPTCENEIDPVAAYTLDAVELPSETADRLVYFHEDSLLPARLEPLSAPLG